MSSSENSVSRRRYEREQKARSEAEQLLENKSRALFLANQKLSEHSEKLEAAVLDRTTELRSALAQAEAATAIRSRFIATKSHEIRTPLGGLLGMIELLSMEETDASKLDLLENAAISGRALNRIVNDVLDFSKMEAGSFVYENDAVDIRALIGSIISLERTNLASEKRVIESEIDNAVPKLFFGDATRIRQVIANLVNNARRYSNSGTITVRAKASPHSDGILLRVEVQDFGIGIAPEQIANLFKDFTQISNPLTAAAQGTGLGLAISKRIIEGCGGTIGVASLVGEGSTFWFELPVGIIQTPESLRPSDLAKNEERTVTDLNGIRVLLAEDNLINQKLLLTYLSRMGARTDLAENGQIALEKFTPRKYDLIIMDAAMPEMDGLEATMHIRSSFNREDVPPIVLLTAHVMAAIQEEAATAGIDLVLCKPILFRELKEAIGELLFASTPNHKENLGTSSSFGKLPKAPSYTGYMSGSAAADLLESFTVEELTELVAEYVNDGHELSAKIRSSFGSADYSAVAAHAHYLKGASLLLGFTQIADFAKSIEEQSTILHPKKLEQITDAIIKDLTSIGHGI